MIMDVIGTQINPLNVLKKYRICFRVGSVLVNPVVCKETRDPKICERNGCFPKKSQGPYYDCYSTPRSGSDCRGEGKLCKTNKDCCSNNCYGSGSAARCS